MGAVTGLAIMFAAIAALTPVALIVMAIADRIDQRNRAERARIVRRIQTNPVRGASYAPDLNAEPVVVRRRSRHGDWEDAIETTFRSMWEEGA